MENIVGDKLDARVEDMFGCLGEIVGDKIWKNGSSYHSS